MNKIKILIYILVALSIQGCMNTAAERTFSTKISNLLEVEDDRWKNYEKSDDELKKDSTFFDGKHLDTVLLNKEQKGKGSISSQFNFKTNSKVNENSYALIIGIAKYKDNTPVEYADKSAVSFRELVNKTFGVPEENIITLLNEEATSGQIKARLELLKELADENGNIYVYFAGHGVPGKDGNTYLLPNDMSADTIHLENNLKLDNIYAKLSKTSSKKVFVFMDSCFSGKDDGGSLLYKGVAPVLKTKKTVISGKKLTILTAGKSTDFANDMQSKRQRMFSYYLIKELSQGNKSLSEVYDRVQEKVKKTSLIKGLGYKQVPQMYGNTEQTLY